MTNCLEYKSEYIIVAVNENDSRVWIRDCYVAAKVIADKAIKLGYTKVDILDESNIIQYTIKSFR